MTEFEFLRYCLTSMEMVEFDTMNALHDRFVSSSKKLASGSSIMVISASVDCAAFFLNSAMDAHCLSP